MFCIKCGAKNPDGSKFCSSCGSAMVEVQKNDHDPADTETSQTASVNSPSTAATDQSAGQTQSAQSPPTPPIIYTPRPPVQNQPAAPTASRATDSYSYDPMKIHCPKCKSERIISKTQTSTTTKTSGYKSGLGCLGWLLWGPLGLLCGLCGMGSKTTVKNSNCFVCQECGKEFLSVNDKIHTLKIGEIQCFVIGIILIILSFFGFSSDVFLALVVLIIGVLFVIGGVFVVKEIHEIELKGYEASSYKEDK